MQATELQALARQPRRIAGSRLLSPSPGRSTGVIPGLAAAGSICVWAGAAALLLVADPSLARNQAAFYMAAATAGFLAAFAIAWWRTRRPSGPDGSVRPWRTATIAGLAVVAASGLSLAGLRLGLGLFALLLPLSLTVVLAGLRLRSGPR